VQLLDLGTHVDTKFRVEVGERLVEQEDVRLAHKRAAHGNTLALTAGELAGLAIEQMVDLQEIGNLGNPLCTLRLFNAVHFHAEGDVPAHRHVRIERIGLKHHGDVPVCRLDPVHAVAPDRDFPGGDVLQTGDHVEQGGLATARRADEDEEFAFLNGDIGFVQDLNSSVGLGRLLDV